MKRLRTAEEDTTQKKIDTLLEILTDIDTVIIGAGAGLSAAAGFTYAGDRFEKYFRDFSDRFGFQDMYSGGFYPYESPEEYWAYWSRYIYVNRYMDPPKNVYSRLFHLVKDKNYFVLTTNVDHCFQKAGFEKERLFYTQGDYGLFQCSEPCRAETFENRSRIREMLLSQGCTFSRDGSLVIPEMSADSMRIPSDLIPRCPYCGRPMSMNLRADDTFVEDDGWHRAAERYTRFLRAHTGGKIIFLELGVGYNTPGIIKYPFWRFTERNTDAMYVCLNKGQAAAPPQISGRSVCINADLSDVLEVLQETI